MGGGGGGRGAYLKEGDQIFNFLMMHYASSEDTQERVSNPLLTEIGTTFNSTGNFCERRRCEFLEGLGSSPQNFQI